MSLTSHLSLLLFVLLLDILHVSPDAEASTVLQKRSLITVDRLERASEIDSSDKPVVTIDIQNCSLPENSNSSFCKSNDGILKNQNVNVSSDPRSILDVINDKDMLLRTLYVTLGVTGIVIIYFIVRAVRLRKKRTKSRKYGIITQQGDRGDMEMEPLGDGNDDDEDYTVFEVNGRKK